MPANRRRVAITAPYDRWILLGKLLAGRRHVLGYTYRAPEFERDTRVNRRLSADLEVAAPKRVNHFSEGSLRLVAHGYRVRYESVMAVLRGERDDLVPVRAEAAGQPADAAPPMDPARAAAGRPWFDEINERRVALAARGITDPDGEQMFPGDPGDAKAWDGIGARLDIGDRVWFIADLRRRADSRAGNSGTGAAGA